MTPDIIHSQYNLRARAEQRGKKAKMFVPDNIDCELGFLNDLGGLTLGEDLRDQAIFKMAMWVRAQPVEPSIYGNINRLLDDPTEANVVLAIAEQRAITEAAPSLLNLRRLGNLKELLLEVKQDHQRAITAFYSTPENLERLEHAEEFLRVFRKVKNRTLQYVERGARTGTKVRLQNVFKDDIQLEELTVLFGEDFGEDFGEFFEDFNFDQMSSKLTASVGASPATASGASSS